MKKYILLLAVAGFISYCIIPWDTFGTADFPWRVLFYIVLGVIGVPLLLGGIIRNVRKRNAARKARLIAQGIPATATILTATRTGLHVNRLPQYEFTLRLVLSDGRQWDVRERKVVDYIYLHRLAPGATLPAYVDPQNDKQIAFLWERADAPTRQDAAVLEPAHAAAAPLKKSGRNPRWLAIVIVVVTLLPLGYFFFSQKQQSDNREYLKANGIQTTAILLDYQSTGSTYNNVPEIRLTLQVKNPNGGTIVVEEVAYFDGAYIGKLNKGMEVPAAIDPEDKEQAAIFWEEAGIRLLF